MPWLKNRQTQIPNGLSFYQPQTGWTPRPHSSFQGIVEALIAHRKGNAYLAQKHGWSVDRKIVEDEVDQWNAAVCAANGWNDYITEAGGGRPVRVPFTSQDQPFPFPPFQQLKQLAVGGSVIVEWVASGEEAVPKEKAEARAAVCCAMLKDEKGNPKACPLNERGDWTRFFTIPASEAIRHEMSKRREWNLETSRDADLKVCTGCWCPLPLKVHMPIQRIISKMKPEQRGALHPQCWILKEATEAGL